MRVIVTILLVLLLAGCGRFAKPAAPVADAPAICYQPCTPSLTDTGVRWDADAESPEAWDALGEEGGVIPALSDRLLQCERARQACAGFINDLKKRGVIRAEKQ